MPRAALPQARQQLKSVKSLWDLGESATFFLDSVSLSVEGGLQLPFRPGAHTPEHPPEVGRWAQ